jgi:hypothetical protein
LDFLVLKKSLQQYEGINLVGELKFCLGASIDVYILLN